MQRTLTLVLASALFTAAPLAAQQELGGFVVTLGKDTVQLEQFVRSPGNVQGTVLYRSPSTRLVRYQAELGPDGRIVRYEQSIHRADGTVIEPNNANARMTFSADTIVREVMKGTERVTVKTPITDAVVPMLGTSPMIPFAYSYLTYELAFGQKRADPARWQFIGVSATQPTASGMRVWPIGTDSAELDYFGVARSGLKFDSSGRLLRSDWSATTYKYSVRRVGRIDLDPIAKRWAAQDAAGTGLTNYSPRDTSNAVLNGANISIDYSRPSRRDRVIWGNVVPWNAVWRLGANMATVLRSDADLVIGDIAVPAGAYSLWLIPNQDGGTLIINKQSGQFGTQYDPRQDLARIPMAKFSVAPPVETLTIEVSDGKLSISWADTKFAVNIRR